MSADETVATVPTNNVAGGLLVGVGIVVVVVVVVVLDVAERVDDGTGTLVGVATAALRPESGAKVASGAVGCADRCAEPRQPAASAVSVAMVTRPEARRWRRILGLILADRDPMERSDR